MNVGQLIDPANRQLVWNIKGGQTALVAQIITILSAARIHDAAEQLIGGVINILRERVVGPYEQAAGQAMNEVHGGSVIDPRANRRESRQISKEAINRKGLRIEVFEIGQGARRSRNSRWDAGIAKECWQRRESASETRESRIESGAGVQAQLDWQLQAACSDITNFDAGIAEELVLHT